MSGPPRAGDHETFDALAVGYALHALEPEDEAVFVVHLPDCPRCARTVAETHEAMAAMAADLPAAEPSEGLRARLRAAVEQTEQAPRNEPPTIPDGDRVGSADSGAGPVAPAEPRPARPAPTPARQPAPPARQPAPPARQPAPPVQRGPQPMRRRVPVVGLVAAAVATIVGLGVWNVVLTSTRDEATRAAAEQRAVLEEVLQPGAQVMARMTDEDGEPMATLVTRDGEMQVVTQGLSVNDDTEEIYVLWGVDGSEPVALGAFDVERSRTDVRAVGSGPTGVGPFEQYAVSLEPGRQPPASPSVVVASGQVAS